MVNDRMCGATLIKELSSRAKNVEHDIDDIPWHDYTEKQLEEHFSEIRKEVMLMMDCISAIVGRGRSDE